MKAEPLKTTWAGKLFAPKGQWLAGLSQIRILVRCLPHIHEAGIPRAGEFPLAWVRCIYTPETCDG